MTLFNLCQKVLREHQDIDYFKFNGNSIRPLNTRKQTAKIEDMANACNIEGNFSYKIVEETYDDYDGLDEQGKEIIIKKCYNICEIKEE